jgi:hypothetical protein
LAADVASVEAYSADADANLTKSQGRGRRFSTRRSYRGKSNPTLRGYSTGYHEAVLTTDVHAALSSGKVPAGTSPEMLALVLKLAESFRTDTAQTPLSGPGGTGAGHSGSGLSQEGQDKAHDLVREALGHILATKVADPGVTPRSVALLMGAITVASMAPGEVARTITGGTKGLKAGATAKVEYEANRNEAKARLGAIYEASTEAERRFAVAGAQRFFDSVGSRSRRLANGRAASPVRKTLQGDPDEVSGAGYESGLDSASAAPQRAPPTAFEDYGFYITQPFRAPRRKIVSLSPAAASGGKRKSPSLAPSQPKKRKTAPSLGVG